MVDHCVAMTSVHQQVDVPASSPPPTFTPMLAPGPDWSVKQLKAYIEQRGGSHVGLVEKNELVGKARELHMLPAPPPPPPPP